MFDVDYEKGKQFAMQQNLDLNRCYENLDAFIQGEGLLQENERIQAVSIVTPNKLHYEFASKLLKAGFHVICEKPMTFTVEEAEELKRIVDERKLTFALTHTYTGYPMVRQMRSYNFV